MKTKMLCFTAAIFLASCTQVTVKRIDPSGKGQEKGIRYSLPKPFILVTPSHDGSVAVEVMMMPDPDNTYAIASYSFLSTYALDMGVEKGMLKRVGSKIDSTQVASDAIKASGAVTSEIFKEQVEAAKAKKVELQTAQNSLTEKEIALEVKKKKLDLLNAQLEEFRKAHPGSSTEIAALQQKVNEEEILLAQAKIERNAEKTKLDRVREEAVRVTPAATSFTASANNSFELSENASNSDLYSMAPKIIDGKGKKKILGPVLFTLDERLNGSPPNQYQTVELHAVEYRRKDTGTSTVVLNKQPEFETDYTYPDKVPEFNIEGTILVRRKEKVNLAFDLITQEGSYPIVNLGTITCSPDTKPRPAVSIIDKKKLHVDVASSMPDGTYELVIGYSYEDYSGELLADNKLIGIQITE